MQNQEKLKKILIIIVVLAMFATSYFYYANKQNNFSAKQPEPVKIAVKKPVKIVKTEIKEKITEEKIKSDEFPEKDLKKSGKKIKPTDKSDLIRIASGQSGKHDPFSYSESRYTPYNASENNLPTIPDLSLESGLPQPPLLPGLEESEQATQKPLNTVEIKGFLGNKVIAEINGYTDSLNTGETLRGVKVLNIDAQNLSCDFEIQGSKVTKSIKPLTEIDNNVEFKYLNNLEELQY
ncbi:MAG TPA: hypothetical protein P5556_00225 [Candidatus Gastranaerophilales bacterium]|nr:hypothetical protein [Candidatus Gastranaerophilales bacterium]